MISCFIDKESCFILCLELLLEIQLHNNGNMNVDHRTCHANFDYLHWYKSPWRICINEDRCNLTYTFYTYSYTPSHNKHKEWVLHYFKRLVEHTFYRPSTQNCACINFNVHRFYIKFIIAILTYHYARITTPVLIARHIL